MNVPVVQTPLETGWPAMVALALLLLGLVLGGRSLLPRRAELPGSLGILGLALLVRLLVIPGWSRHLYDGHEAEYWDIFRGARELSRGGPLLYPAMQWAWWGLGRVLPHDEHVPVLISTAVGVLGLLSLSLAMGRLAQDARVGFIAGLVLALHPVHAAWSSSAYPVIHPQAFGALAFLALVAGNAPELPGARTRPALGLVAGSSLALAIGTRLEAGLLLLPCLGLLLLPRARTGTGVLVAPRERLKLVPGLVLGLGLALLAARPILWPGELPGSGERGGAFAINVDLLDYYAPYDSPPVLALLVLAAALALYRARGPSLLLLGTTLANHLVMSGFDDMGDRHTLTGLWGIAWALGMGAFAFPPDRRRGGLALALGGILVTASGLPEMRRLYYADEAAFQAELDARTDKLPRAGLAELRRVLAPPERCGLVAEDPRIAADPPRSHFNLLDAAEAQALRGPDGCLRWCAGLQDWRWSSRAVRDRAIRIRHLYELRPLAVIEDPDSGYACLLQALGPRLR